MMHVDFALKYASVHWAVLPVHTVEKGKCSCRFNNCKSPGKHPRISGGVHQASADSDVIKKWWADWPDANIAIATGKRSGLIVLDIDTRHGGLESLEKLQERFKELPSSLKVKTGSGGLHYYFRYPDTKDKDSYNVPNKQKLIDLPGLDIRADNGYVLAPPSHHISGEVYKWIN